MRSRQLFNFVWNILTRTPEVLSYNQTPLRLFVLTPFLLFLSFFDSARLPVVVSTTAFDRQNMRIFSGTPTVNSELFR
jgi:hypothetical protein